MDADDKRIAKWLGISYDDTTGSGGRGRSDSEDQFEDDEDSKNRTPVSDNDFITIKIDDKVFRTMRGTLTQVPHSFMAKLFGAHSDMIHRDETDAYCLNCDPEIFGQVLNILRRRGTMTPRFKMTHELCAALVDYGLWDAFFSSYNLSELGIGNNNRKDKENYHIVFQSWRSSDNNSNYMLSSFCVNSCY